MSSLLQETNPECFAAGLSRLQRWERARKLGLDPPREIKELIEAAEEPRRAELNRCTWEEHNI